MTKLQEFKKMGEVAVLGVLMTAAVTGFVAFEYFQHQTQKTWEKDIKEVPTLINQTIEKNLVQQGLTGGIYEKMKSIQALGGECADMAKDLRKDYNSRIEAVYTRAQKSAMPSSAGEGVEVYPYNILDNVAQTTDFLMKKYAGDLEEYENPPIPESKPEKFQQMIAQIRQKASELQACVNKPKS